MYTYISSDTAKTRWKMYPAAEIQKNDDMNLPYVVIMTKQLQYVMSSCRDEKKIMDEFSINSLEIHHCYPGY